jgi:hypothetical protein
MASSGMLRHVTLVKPDVSDERGDSSETSVLTRAKRHNIPKHAILHSQRRENLKSYRNFMFRLSFGPGFDSRRYQIF